MRRVETIRNRNSQKNLESCCGWFLLHTHLSSVQCQQSYNSCSGVWNTQSSCSHQRKYTLVRKLMCPFLHSFCYIITNVWATKCNDVTSRSIFSLLFSRRQSKIKTTKTGTLLAHVLEKRLRPHDMLHGLTPKTRYKTTYLTLNLPFQQWNSKDNLNWFIVHWNLTLFA